MGKRADALQKEFLLNLKTLRENYAYQRGAAEMSAQIADDNKSPRVAAYHTGQHHGFDEAIELLDCLIRDWED